MREIKDIICPIDTPFIIDKKGGLAVIRAGEVKGYRIFEDFSGVDYSGMDKEWMKLGYLSGMKKNKNGVRIKIPENELELQELFGRETTFTTDEYNMDFTEIPQEYWFAFIRGLFSAVGKVDATPKGWMRLGLGDTNLNNDQKKYINDNIFPTLPFDHSHNSYGGGQITLSRPDQISWFIRNIGIIQDRKDDKVYDLYRMKQRPVKNVIEIGEDYLLYHVKVYGEKSDYHEGLLGYDVNYHSKYSDTALHIALMERKKLQYNNYYPIIWLIENGADVNIKNYADKSPLDLIRSFSFVDRYSLVNCLLGRSKDTNGVKELVDCLFERGLISSKTVNSDDQYIQKFMKVYLRYREEPTSFRAWIDLLVKNRIKCQLKNIDFPLENADIDILVNYHKRVVEEKDYMELPPISHGWYGDGFSWSNDILLYIWKILDDEFDISDYYSDLKEILVVIREKTVKFCEKVKGIIENIQNNQRQRNALLPYTNLENLLGWDRKVGRMEYFEHFDRKIENRSD